MAIYVQNLWRYGGKCVTSQRNQQKTKDYVVLFMEEAAAEGIQGQTAVDAGRGVYFALYSTSAI